MLEHDYVNGVRRTPAMPSSTPLPAPPVSAPAPLPSLAQCPAGGATPAYGGPGGAVIVPEALPELLAAARDGACVPVGAGPRLYACGGLAVLPSLLAALQVTSGAVQAAASAEWSPLCGGPAARCLPAALAPAPVLAAPLAAPAKAAAPAPVLTLLSSPWSPSPSPPPPNPPPPSPSPPNPPPPGPPPPGPSPPYASAVQDVHFGAPLRKRTPVLLAPAPAPAALLSPAAAPAAWPPAAMPLYGPAAAPALQPCGSQPLRYWECGVAEQPVLRLPAACKNLTFLRLRAAGWATNACNSVLRAALSQMDRPIPVLRAVCFLVDGELAPSAEGSVVTSPGQGSTPPH